MADVVSRREDPVWASTQHNGCTYQAAGEMGAAFKPIEFSKTDSVQNLGYLEIARKFRCHLKRKTPTASLEGLTVAQRIAGMSHVAPALAQWVLWICYLAIPFFLLSGYPVVVYCSTAHLRWLLCLGSLRQIVIGSSNLSCLLFVPYKSALRSDQSEVWMVPCKCPS